MDDILRPNLPFDDPDWQKQRKKEWKIVKKRVDSMHYSRDEKKAIKEFFFTGRDAVYEKFGVYPSFDHSPLIDIWFFWGDKPELWDALFTKWIKMPEHLHPLMRGCRDTFTNITGFIGVEGAPYLPGSDESFFSGMEAKLFNCFYPEGYYAFKLSRAYNEDEVKAAHHAAAIGIAQLFNEYFRINVGNRFNMVNFLVEDWIAAQEHGFNPDSALLKNLFCYFDKILKHESKHSPVKVDFAKRINAIVAEKGPQKLIDLAAAVRARPDHPKLFPGV